MIKKKTIDYLFLIMNITIPSRIIDVNIETSLKSMREYFQMVTNKIYNIYMF